MSIGDEKKLIKKVKISLPFQEIKKPSIIAVGNIIRSKWFVYGIQYPMQQKEVLVGWTANEHACHLKEGLKCASAIDAYDLLRGDASFLILSTNLVEVILPEDVKKHSRYLGLNIKCIRLTDDKKLYKNSERILFTQYHSMSCLSIEYEKIELVGQIKLPIYWSETTKEEDLSETVF